MKREKEKRDRKEEGKRKQRRKEREKAKTLKRKPRETSVYGNGRLPKIIQEIE